MSSPSFSSILPVITAPLLYMTLVPATFFAVGINELVRFVISKFFLRQFNGEITLISDGGDAIWSHVKKGNCRNILVYAVTPKDQLNVNILKKMFDQRVLAYKDSDGKRPYEKIKNIVVNMYGYPCWKKCPNFNLKNHFKVMKDRVYTEDEVKRWLSTFSEDMDDKKPQWELIVFPVYKGRIGII